jgi:hypothetical protein
MTIDVGKEFSTRLTNRNKRQGDGTHTADEFRKKYLSDFDSADAWTNGILTIELDFANVFKIGPSFANEAFAYFMKYTKPEEFLRRIVFKNLSRVKQAIIEDELKTGYCR